MVVFFEVWIEGDSKEPVFLVAEDFDLGEGGAVPGDRMDSADFSLKFDKVNRPIRPEIHPHGAGEVFRDGLDFEAEGINGAGDVGEGEKEERF